MYTKILVAHEKMDDASRALEKAAGLAAALHAELFVLGILSPGPRPILNLDHTPPEDLEHGAAFAQLHQQTQAWAHAKGLPVQVQTVVGNPIKLIERFATEHAIDLIVLGDVELSAGWGSMIDHSAERVGLTTHCDVLIVR